MIKLHNYNNKHNWQTDLGTNKTVLGTHVAWLVGAERGGHVESSPRVREGAVSSPPCHGHKSAGFTEAVQGYRLRPQVRLVTR